MTPEETEAILIQLSPYLSDRRFLRTFDSQMLMPELSDFPVLFENIDGSSGWVICQKPADIAPYAANSLMIGTWVPLKVILEIVASIESGEPCLATIRMLDYLLAWDFMEDEDVQLILREIDQDTLVKALLVEISGMQDKVINNMSAEAGSMLTKKIHALQGIVPIAESYEACKNISETITHLVKQGLIYKMEQSPGASRVIHGINFNFEEVQFLDDQLILKLIKIVQPETWAFALKGVSNDLMCKIFANMPLHLKEAIKTHMNFLGPTRLSEVETKQQDILEIIEQLMDGASPH